MSKIGQKDDTLKSHLGLSEQNSIPNKSTTAGKMDIQKQFLHLTVIQEQIQVLYTNTSFQRNFLNILEI